MRQIWIPRAGPPEVLSLREAADPLPGHGEVRIRVEACGVNFADIMGRLGLYPDLPSMPVVPGYEVAGRVDAVGESIETDWIGRDVVSLTRFGGYSDVVCVPEHQVFSRPDGISSIEGAALPVNYLTAYQLVEVMGSLRPGDTVPPRRQRDRHRLCEQARLSQVGGSEPLHRLPQRALRQAGA